MRISKKKLLSLLNENIEKQKKLREMAMDFDTPDRPHRDITDKLRTGETPYKKVPLPQTNNPEQNFQELLASERYREVIANIRQYIGNGPTLRGEEGLGPLANAMMGALMSIIQIEHAHKHELEQLAIDIVKKEMGIPEDAVQYEAKIVGIGEVSSEGFNRMRPRQEEEPEAPEINDQDWENDEENNEDGEDEQGFEEPQGNELRDEDPEDETPDEEENAVDVEMALMRRFENMTLEKAKRRFINGIIQGASDKGHYMYHYAADRLNEISPELVGLYGMMMAANDAIYWQVGERMMDTMMGGTENQAPPRPQAPPPPPQGGQQRQQRQQPQMPQGVNPGGTNMNMAGRQDIDRNTEPPTIRAIGVNFPVLIHELIKGTLELFAIHGRPESDEDYAEVEASEDTLAKENWDLRLGPALWNRIRSMFPDDVLSDESKYEIQNYILMEIFRLPPKKFFVFMKEVLGRTQRGINMMDDLVDGIYKMLNDEDYNEETTEFQDELEDATNEISDEDFTSFLTSLGINREDLNMDNLGDNRLN